MDVRVGPQGRLSAEELMLLSCGAGEDSWESLGSKESKSVSPKGNQPWIFAGRTDAEVEVPIRWLFVSHGQSIGASTSTSVLLMNFQDWFPLGLTGLISLQSKGLSNVFSSTTAQKHQFFGIQPSIWSNSHIHTWPLEKPQLWLDGPLLAK